MGNQFDGIDCQLLPTLQQLIMAAVLIDENARVLFFNSAAEQLWGYERYEVLGKSIDTLFQEAFWHTHSSHVCQDQESAESVVVGVSQKVLKCQDGQQRRVILALSKIEADGRIYYLALLNDVSDEIVMSEYNRLLLLAVNHTDRAVIVFDRKRHIIQINQAFTQLYGYEAIEVIGREPDSFLLSDNMPSEEAVWFRSLPWGQERVQADALVVSKNGRESWARISSTPIRKSEDDALQAYSVDFVSDVTAERLIRDLERDVLEALTSNLSFEKLGIYLSQRLGEIAPDVIPSVLQVDFENKLRPWSVARLPAQYSASINGITIGEGVGGCGTAAMRGERVLSIDIETDPLWSPFKNLALSHQLRACWSYPIKRRDGSVAGVFAFYAHEKRAPTAFHERIIKACIHLCALAIEREENRQQMARLVQFDMLTGLPNRSHLLRHIDSLLASDTSLEVTFFCLDLDRFKDVNNMLGHVTGDQALVAVANRLQVHLKSGEFLSRTEGDLFVIVAPDCDVRHAALLAESIQEIIGMEIEIGGHRFNLSASVGISHYPEGGSDRDILLANAKHAMYRAKKSGGGSYQFFAPEMNLMARDRLLLGTALKRAITQSGLRLQYQPQVHPHNGGLYGVEALARWCDPEWGDIPPDKFISLAEEIGEIEAIGRWALREACRQMAVWREAGVLVPVVSVNLSPLNFRSRDLPDFISGLLCKYGLSGENLTIEITESTAMNLTTDMMDLVHRIRALGVGLSVDDFGTGFSSLSNLANLPVTEVKIDRSFIDKYLEESRFQFLVMAVIGIGQSLELTVVAEGVETEAQFEQLRLHNCPVVQGYLFSRPLEPRDLSNWITARNRLLSYPN